MKNHPFSRFRRFSFLSISLCNPKVVQQSLLWAIVCTTNTNWQVNNSIILPPRSFSPQIDRNLPRVGVECQIFAKVVAQQLGCASGL
jgi:hypothetical protein